MPSPRMFPCVRLRTALRQLMRMNLALLAPLLVSVAPALAQTLPATPGAPAGAEAAQGPAASADRRVQKTVVQDAGSRIEEVRYGGETQSISVVTPGAMPPYEVIPPHGARQRPAGQRDGAPGSTGMRVWNIGSF